MNLIKTVVFLIVFIMFFSKTIAQPGNNRTIKTLNVDNGLPQSFVSALIQDNTGFIWVATRDGLARYDGRKFKVFMHVPGDMSTLSNNIITSLFLDTKSRLWILYETGDVDIMNTQTEILSHFTNDALYKQVYNNLRVITPISEDKAGNIWMLCNNNGIYLCNIDKRFLHFYSDTALGLVNNRIIGMSSNKGNIALVTNNALIIMDDKRNILSRIPYTFSDAHIQNSISAWKDSYALFRQNGEIVIHDDRRLLIYQPAVKRFIEIPLKDTDIFNNNILQDSKGNVYFTHNLNIYFLSLDNKLSVWKPENENPKWGFRSMLLDRSGVLWTGSNGAGIQLYDLRLSHLPGIKYNLTFPEDVLKTSFHVPDAEIKSSFLNNMFPYRLRWAKDNNKKIWFSQAGNALILTPVVCYCQNGHIVQPQWHYTDTMRSRHVCINAIGLSKAGKLWGIDYFMRPVYLDTASKAATVYPSVASVNFNYPYTANNLFIDGENNFWITTALNGLYFYNRHTGKTIHYAYSEKAGSLPTNQLMNIVQDPLYANILWIGSLGGGLIKFNKISGKCRFYTVQDGLPDNTVYAVIADSKGKLWCSSNKGIFSFDPLTGETLQSFTSKDGLPGDEFNRYHFLVLPGDSIAFGGIDGYTAFNPLTVSKDNFQPQVAITAVNVNNKPADYGDALSPFKEAINNQTQIKLPYDKNFLSFEFAALEYNVPEKLKYRYILENFDKDWVYTSNNNIAAYTKLPHSKYTFKINATNTAGEWSKYVKTLIVIIQPPFWEAWWFTCLWLLAVIVLIYYFLRSRVIAIQKKERQKMKFEQEASELKAQALRAQMNPHFIFNSLNSIKALIQEDKKQEAVIYLTTFSKLIRTQLNNAQQEVSLHEELETCRLYAQLEALRFGAKIECSFMVDENIDTSSLKVPPLILQPFIENAIWHGILPKKSGKVLVTVKRDNDTIECMIDDDGIGRDMAMRNKSQTSSTYESKGMGLVKNRLTMYNNISANKASIEVIDKKENNKPSGTLVIIKFKPEA